MESVSCGVRLLLSLFTFLKIVVFIRNRGFSRVDPVPAQLSGHRGWGQTS